MEAVMTLPEVTRTTTPVTPRTTPGTAAGTGEGRQLDAEHSMIRAGVLGLVISLPVMIALLVGMMGIAIGDMEPWYVWVGLGAGLGVYAALFLGSVSGVLTSATRLDEVSKEIGD
jgi:hypothetical protein